MTLRKTHDQIKTLMFMVFNTMVADVFDLELYPPHYRLTLGADLNMTAAQAQQLHEHIVDQFNGVHVNIDPNMTLDDLYKAIIRVELSQLLEEGVVA